jgi:hypothetical protein
MRAYIQEHVGGQVFRPSLKDLLVDFNEAASSSLNLIIVAVFDGSAAEHYWSIRRFLQRTALDAGSRLESLPASSAYHPSASEAMVFPGNRPGGNQSM